MDEKGKKSTTSKEELENQRNGSEWKENKVSEIESNTKYIIMKISLCTE